MLWKEYVILGTQFREGAGSGHDAQLNVLGEEATYSLSITVILLGKGTNLGRERLGFHNHFQCDLARMRV